MLMSVVKIRLNVLYRVSKKTNAFHIFAGIRQFPCVQPTGRGYYCAKEEFHVDLICTVSLTFARLECILTDSYSNCSYVYSQHELGG